MVEIPKRGGGGGGGPTFGKNSQKIPYFFSDRLPYHCNTMLPFYLETSQRYYDINFYLNHKTGKSKCYKRVNFSNIFQKMSSCKHLSYL